MAGSWQAPDGAIFVADGRGRGGRGDGERAVLGVDLGVAVGGDDGGGTGLGRDVGDAGLGEHGHDPVERRDALEDVDADGEATAEAGAVGDAGDERDPYHRPVPLAGTV